MQQIDRSSLRLAMSELEKVMKPVCDKLGLSLKMGGGSFTPQNAVCKFTIAVQDGSGNAVTREAEDFKRYAKSYGLSPDDLHRTFIYAGRQYKILGLAPRSAKYPILAERDGKTVKMPLESVKAGLHFGSKEVT